MSENKQQRHEIVLPQWKLTTQNWLLDIFQRAKFTGIASMLTVIASTLTDIFAYCSRFLAFWIKLPVLFERRRKTLSPSKLDAQSKVTPFWLETTLESRLSTFHKPLQVFPFPEIWIKFASAAIKDPRMFEHWALTSQRGEKAVHAHSSTSKRNNKKCISCAEISSFETCWKTVHALRNS